MPQTNPKPSLRNYGLRFVGFGRFGTKNFTSWFYGLFCKGSLALLLNNKAEFILLHNERTGCTLSKSEVDWSQSKVIFVAQSFTIHQQRAINFKDLPIELWQLKKYANGTVLYAQLKAKNTSESIKTVTKDTTIQKVSSEVRVYNISDHFTGKKQAVWPLYESFKERVLGIAPEAQENPRRGYIGFSLKDNGSDTFSYINILQEGLRVTIPRIRPDDVTDNAGVLEYKKNSVETKNTPESIMLIRSEEDIDTYQSIIRQVIKKKF